ncbi:MAG: phosphoribosyl-AMP cyclohydrolase [Syntrophaceae bacterium]|jgi:phosphoribosyl-AMP cyclohydrolase|nr:phosphoribosyl-AMP cyclohydrolase [Syntrophaceae bacterium]HOC58565.1 phosphoribosyl-AMP cyclohydrolase [Smithellaceae bacterium]HQM46346.1 phosphoribosyl-AMP cyclohydrolase [Smithellaceae bacterium]
MIEPNFNKSDGLVPAIIQDANTKDVLMLAYMNRESWQATLQSGKATFWSRSRQKLWVKGESSGHVQIIKNIYLDCDEDTILLQVEQVGGAACHTGHRSCFYRKLQDGDFIVVGEKVFNPQEVYR